MRAAVRTTFAALALYASLLLVHAQTFTVLHYFTGGADGANPRAGLTMDSHGNLYGTAGVGGPGGISCDEGFYGCGTVFELKRTADGWVFIPLASFTGGTDGGVPRGRVVFGPDGTLYGTTSVGGDLSCNGDGNYGCGTVFNVRPPASFCRSVLCPWTVTTLHVFTGGQNDGALPLGDLTFDQAGNIYGTTLTGGLPGNCYNPWWMGIGSCGTVFELSPSNGGWTETLLYRFTGDDGGTPAAGVTFDAQGNIYGTTQTGGAYDYGTVFELTHTDSGWVERRLYSLECATSGCYPAGDVTFDAAGNLYSTTQLDGIYGDGTVFELTPTLGQWSLSKVYPFAPAEGNLGPGAGVTFNSAGNLYGTDANASGFGTVFSLTPSASGFSYNLLHAFTGYDGGNPTSTVSIDAQGNLYGTATATYAPYWGTIWEITP